MDSLKGLDIFFISGEKLMLIVLFSNHKIYIVLMFPFIYIITYSIHALFLD